MIIAIRAGDLSKFIVASMALAGESIDPPSVTPDMVRSFLALLARQTASEKMHWTLMLAAEATDEQWGACVRILRSIAVERPFAIFAVLTDRAEELRRQPEWREVVRAQNERARAQVAHELRIENGGRLS